MGYEDHEDPGADATRAFRALRPPSVDGVRYADSGRLPDSGRRPDGGNISDGNRSPRAGWHPDTDTGTYPVLDWYAGYEGYADDQPGQPQAPAEERSFTRPYARPADPWAAPPSGHGPGKTGPSLAARLARLRPDRWVLAGGGLVATVAVIVAFATAGGSTVTPGARTAQTATTHSVQPACVSPAVGH